MASLDEVIARLEELRSLYGGDLPVKIPDAYADSWSDTWHVYVEEIDDVKQAIVPSDTNIPEKACIVIKGENV